MIFLLNQCHSKVEKSIAQTMVQSTGKSDFSVLFQQLQQKLGVEERIALFYRKTVSGKSEHKLQAAVLVLGWYLFNLNEKTIVKKRKMSSFLITKMYDINFYQQLLARVCSTKWKQFVWTRKGIPNKRCYLGNSANYKIFFIKFSRIKSTFTIEKFINDFWNDFSRTTQDDCFC